MPRSTRILLALLLLCGLAAGLAVYLERSTAGADLEEPAVVNLSELQELQEPADLRILFVGNSLTYANDLPAMVEALAEDQNDAWEDVLTYSVTPGGARFGGHAATLWEQAGDTPLRQALITGSAELRDWDYVVLQDQSQLPGLPPQHPEARRSIDGLRTLSEAVANTQATVVLYQTWGFWDGDPYNTLIYESFLAMNARLAAGYERYRAQLGDEHPHALVAPAGRAFEGVYRELDATGEQPLAEGSLFRRLYADDRHPSVLGTYLVACVFVATLTGEEIGEDTWTPDGVGDADARVLRRVANAAVFGAR